MNGQGEKDKHPKNVIKGRLFHDIFEPLSLTALPLLALPDPSPPFITSASSPISPMSTDHKQEYPADKEIVDEKFDVERSSVVLEEEENSPIPEVAAIVSNKDDPSLPVMTFRFWVMAIFFAFLLSFFNQFL